jgi:glycosyltransferase involved in cell wall biosynthesis
MKILLINKFLYPKGGDAICALVTGELLRSKGHEVVFWGMQHPTNPGYPHADLFVDNLDLNNAGGIGKQIDIAAKLLYSVEAKNKVEALIKRIGKPDIVHLHNFAHQISPSILDVFKKHKIPVVMTMHDYKLVCVAYTLLSQGKPCEKCADGKYYQCLLEGCVKDSRAKSLLNTAEMYLHHKLLHIYDSIHTFISPSAFLKAKLEAMGFKGKVVHLPNFVCPDEFVPRYDWAERSICFVGRLSREKGIATLIEAVKGLDVTLKIIGEGPLEEELVSSVKCQGIKNVQFMGYMTGDVLREEIRKSMFVVIPSEWYENNPLSALEAFALGKPVIGARIGGIPELVQDNETGLTFESGNAQDLADKIQTLVNQPDLIAEMGKTARLFVESELNSEKHYAQLMTIYQQAIEKKQATPA